MAGAAGVLLWTHDGILKRGLTRVKDAMFPRTQQVPSFRQIGRRSLISYASPSLPCKQVKE